ncbi:MAG: ion transporter [Candidatus Cyclobacteriaceae bacterium M2_1C_046]
MNQISLSRSNIIFQLRKVILDNDTKAGRNFDLFVQSMIILSLIAFSIETLPNLGFQTRKYLKFFEWFSVITFSIEYILRLILNPRPLKFALSFFGIVDILAILPFYLSVGVDLRSLRAFRLLRLFLLLKMMRYSVAVGRFRKALLLVREELILFFSATFILMFLAGVGIYYFERYAQPKIFSSIFHSLWWAVATLTTVGYGDIYPVTTGGKLFTFFILMIGLGIISIPTGLIASALSKARELEE